MKTLALAAGAALAGILAFGGNAHAQDVPMSEECVSPADQLAMVVKNVPDIQIYREYTGPAAYDFMVELNAVPPVTTFTAEAVIVYSADSIPAAYFVVTYEGGCRNHGGGMARSVVDKIITAVEGAGA